MSGRVALFGLLTLACCTTVPAEVEPSEPPPTPEPELPAAELAPDLTTSSYSSDAPVLLRANTTFEAGPVVLHEDGWLIAGEYGRHIEIDEYAAQPGFNDHQKNLEVIRLAPEQLGILLTFPSGDAEDPPTLYRLYTLPAAPETELFEALNMYVGSYNHHDLAFPGDGTARYMEDGWAACDREGHPTAPVKLHEVWLSADETRRFSEFKRIEHDEEQDCSMLAG